MNSSSVEALLEAPLDLSMSALSTPAPGALAAATRMGSARLAVACAFALVAVIFAAAMWRQRAQPLLTWIWPGALVVPFFALIALVLGFGRHEKRVDANARRLEVSAGLGPLSARRVYELTPGDTLVVSFEKERGSSAGGGPVHTTRRYTVRASRTPALSFCVTNDRDAARALAGRLSGLLGYSVDDRAEDDGVERRAGP